MKTAKGILLSIFIVIALVAALYLSKQTTIFSPKATTSYQEYLLDTEIELVESSSDLDNLLMDLDSIDVDQIDQDLQDNQVDSTNI